MNKRIIKRTVFTLLTFLVIPAIVHAEPTLVSTAEEFNGFIQNGGEIKLNSDISLSANTLIRGDLILDLNNHTLNMSSKTLLPYAKLTIKDSSSEKNGRITGTANYVVQVGSSTTEGSTVLESGKIDCSNKSYCVIIAAKGKFTMNDGLVVSKNMPLISGGVLEINGGEVLATNGTCVYGNTNGLITLNNGIIRTTSDYEAVLLSKPGSKFVMNGGKIEALNETGHKGAGVGAFKDTEFIMNNGEIISAGPAIIGNGSVSGKNEGTNAKFTINGGTVTSTQELGIYAPQPNGITTINGGTITGATTGIEIRAGKLIVNGGTISGNTTTYSITSNTNGSGTTGTAVAIIQHTTKQPIEVVIQGGTFNGYLPLIESNPLGNSAEDVSQITIDISASNSNSYPTFNASGDTTIYSEDVDDFITAGIYTSSVEEYIKDGYAEKSENTNQVVHKIRNVSADNDAPDSLQISMSNALVGDTITLSAPTVDGYTNVFEVYDAAGNLIGTTTGEFTMPDQDVTVNLVYTKNDKNDENTSNTEEIKNPQTSDRTRKYISAILLLAITGGTTYMVKKYY